MSNAPLETRPLPRGDARRLRLRAGARVRVTATFNGNAKLKARSAEPVVRYRVK